MHLAAWLLQEPAFHAAFQDAPLDVPWLLSRETLRSLPRGWLHPFRRWNLRYLAARVASIPNYPYFETASSIPFKLWPVDSPWRAVWSFNATEDVTPFLRPGEIVDTSFIGPRRGAG